MITSISEEVTSYRRRSQVTPLDVAFKKLNDFIDKVDEKITDRLQLVQHTYLDEYKEQMAVMTQELQRLRNNLDKQVLREKASDRMIMLEEERDFFRAQVVKLNQEVNRLSEINRGMKKELGDSKSQLSNFKKIAFNYEQKVQKLQNQRTALRTCRRENSAPNLRKRTAPKLETIQGRDREEEHIEQRAVSTAKQGRRVRTVRTKTFSKYETATKMSIKRYQQFNDCEHIIDQCIKELKKDIFLRNSENKTERTVLPDDFAKVAFDKFTRTDRKNLVYKLLSSEKMLEEFNEFLSAKSAEDSANRMVRTKLGDNKFNDKFLSDLKRSFSRKMFSLKASNEPLHEDASKRKLDYF